MDLAFFDFADCLRLYSNRTPIIKVLFTKWIDECKQIEHVRRDLFYDRYHSEIQEVYISMQSYPELQEHSKDIYDIFLEHSPKNIAHIVEQFIRGITHFHRELPTYSPLYNRLYAHHDRATYFRKNNASEHTVKTIVKDMIEKVYLERLIYYTYHSYLFPDDKSIEAWIQDSSAEYNNHFVNKTIEVELEYQDKIPIKLTILFTEKNITTTVVYKRSRIQNNYDPDIKCFKYFGNKEFTRIQRFDIYTMWI